MGGFADLPLDALVAKRARILVIDVETAPMIAATFRTGKQRVGIHQVLEPSYLMSFAAKWHGYKKIIYRSTFHDGRTAMVRELAALMDEAHIVVHYNGARFDEQKIEQALMLEGFDEPSPFKRIDLLPTARRFGFDSSKLDWVAQQVGLGGKMQHSGFDMWLACMNGDEKAWAMFRRYNMADTELEDRLYTRWRPWIRNHPNMGLFAPDHELRCTNCGRSDLTALRDTPALTDVTAYEAYRCVCGKVTRSKHRKNAAVMRGVTR
jgi:hypothetical protein